MRAAVIGVGSMGTNHARVYSELDEVELVAVADSSGVAVDEHGFDPAVVCRL